MTQLTDLVRIDDPAFYLDPHRVYDRMRLESPAFYYEPLDIFVLTRYDDMRAVVRQPEIFTSTKGILLTELMYAPSEEGGSFIDQFVDPEGELFSNFDPPRSTQLRKVLSPGFSVRSIGLLSERIARDCKELVGAIPAGETIDFVEQLAAPLPILSAAHLLGVDASYVPDIRRWSDALEMIGSGAFTAEELAAAAGEFSELNDFIREQVAYKRTHPGEDLLSSLLAAELDGAPLSEARILVYCHIVLAVGSDTTKSLLSGMAVALTQFPKQRERLAADRSLMATAIEEGVRWTTPARGFVRTAVVDTEIGGQAIRAGQRVYVLYAAGNFDPEVFEHPHEFDVARTQELQHLGFGSGAHSCIGLHLARIEASLLFNELLDRFPRFELDAAPVPVFHILRNGLKFAPMKFHPAPL
jgi:cytochrome P450